MKKRRLIAALLGVMLCFGTACGETESKPEPKESIESETEVSPEEETEATTEAETEPETELKTEPETEPKTEEVTEKPVAENSETDESDDYAAAYKKYIEENVLTLENADKITYGLIYLDEDDVPELVYGNLGFWVSMCTYKNGEVYTPMDGRRYGAMGNAGYEYCPKMNSIRNYDSDLAGAVVHVSYMRMSDSYELEYTKGYDMWFFDDINEDYCPDEGEMLEEPKYYISEKEVTEDEVKALDVGEYEYISAEWTLDELYEEFS